MPMTFLAALIERGYRPESQTALALAIVDLERLCDQLTALAALGAVSPPESPRALLAVHVAHPEQVDTLLDLARDGEHETFTGLAACLGVAPDALEPLWDGTRRRLGR